MTSPEMLQQETMVETPERHLRMIEKKEEVDWEKFNREFDRAPSRSKEARTNKILKKLEQNPYFFTSEELARFYLDSKDEQDEPFGAESYNREKLLSDLGIDLNRPPDLAEHRIIDNAIEVTTFGWESAKYPKLLFKREKEKAIGKMGPKQAGLDIIEGETILIERLDKKEPKKVEVNQSNIAT